MDRDRYRPTVAVWSFSEDDAYTRPIQDLGVALHVFDGATSPAVKLARLRRLVRQLKPEVVHSYSFYTNIAAWWATRGTTAIPIGAVQSNFIRDKKESGPWLGRLSAVRPRVQVFNSFSAAENARRARSFFAPADVKVVRNGLDLELFQSTPTRFDEPVCIVGVGSLLAVKRWDRLLHVARALDARGLKYAIKIVGDGPLREALERQARELGVADRVTFVGHSANVPAALTDASFLVHTSEIEGCSNVLLEAMACGRAVVATDAGDAPSVIDDGRTGFVVRRGDDEALAARVATLITERDLCRRMGEAGRRKAEREFGVQRLVSETLGVYESAGWINS